MDTSGDDDIRFPGIHVFEEMNSDKDVGKQDDVISLCGNWTPARMLLEVVVILILLTNCFCVFIIATASSKTSFHSLFNKLCILLISFSTIGLCLQFCFFPLAFPRPRKPSVSEIPPSNAVTMFTPYTHKYAFYLNETMGYSCHGTKSAACKWSGFLFSCFSYFPLAVGVAMSIDRIVATFCWKFYKFRKHAVSAFRLTLLIGFLATFCFMFIIPFLNIGASYRFDSFSLLCVLPRTSAIDMNRNFALIVQSFAFVLLALLLVTASFVASAVYHHSSGRRRSCKMPKSSLVCGHFGVVKSKSWLDVSKTTLATIFVGVVSYLPLSIISLTRIFMQEGIASHQTLDIITDAFILILPTFNPFVLVWFYAPYRRRAKTLWNKLKNRRSVIPEVPGSDEESYNSPANLRGYRNVANDLIRVSHGKHRAHRNTSGIEMDGDGQRHRPFRYNEEIVKISREGSDRDYSNNQIKNKQYDLHQRRIPPVLRPYHSHGEQDVLVEGRSKGKGQRRRDLKRQKRVQVTPPELLIDRHLDECFSNILKNMNAAEVSIFTDSSGHSKGSNNSYGKANEAAPRQSSFEGSRCNRSSENPSTSSYRPENIEVDYDNAFLESVRRASVENIVPVNRGSRVDEDYRKTDDYEDIPYQLPGQFLASDELNNPVFKKRSAAYPSEYHYHHHSHYYQGNIRKFPEQHDRTVVARRRGSEPYGDLLVAELRGKIHGNRERSHVVRQESAVEGIDRRARGRPAREDDNIPRRGRRHVRKYGASSFDNAKEASPPPYDVKPYHKNSR